ncbi:T6SS effector phospholipase Tle3 domain-containing protein, partial [Pantoea sp. C2G6]|uniref:T6SS effector phospholipase Tle3 domain-containing protein n=1 Tax=Pantoea sp. C2G6 TaxID=3243084 RepID=UPI003EDAA9B9
MVSKQPEPLRKAVMECDDNGKSSWRGMCSHKNIMVRAGCHHPVQLPGLIIFVHGVNSEGEWYDKAEENICTGLNVRLHLPEDMWLVKNIYKVDKIRGRELTSPGSSRSPVIRFYWGYSAKPGTEDDYQIPLRNLAGEDYHDLKK